MAGDSTIEQDPFATVALKDYIGDLADELLDQRLALPVVVEPLLLAAIHPDATQATACQIASLFEDRLDSIGL